MTVVANATSRRSFPSKGKRPRVRITLPDSKTCSGREVILRAEERDRIECVLSAPLLAHAVEFSGVGLFALMHEDLEDVGVRHQLRRHQTHGSNARGLEVEVGPTHPSARHNHCRSLLVDENLGFDRKVLEAGHGPPEHMEELPVGRRFHQSRFNDGAHVDPSERGVDDSDRGAHRNEDDTRLSISHW